VVVPEKQGLKLFSSFLFHSLELYKWWFQKNKDWNLSLRKTSWPWRHSWYKWWFQKNKDWNIANSGSLPFPLFWYKWWFQKNKDWNTRRSPLEKVGSFLYKWWFQKNKDWNPPFFGTVTQLSPCISGGSRKTRIESKLESSQSCDGRTCAMFKYFSA